METSTPRRLKRSERARQMREAQRRRRERLRKDNRRFLQIILPEGLRTRLYSMSERSQQTLQDFVLTLIQQAIKNTPPDDILVEREHSEAEDHFDMSSEVVSGMNKAMLTSHSSEAVVASVVSADSSEEPERAVDAMDTVEFVPEEELAAEEESSGAESSADKETPVSGDGGHGEMEASAPLEEAQASAVAPAETPEVPAESAGDAAEGKPRRRGKTSKPTNQMELF